MPVLVNDRPDIALAAGAAGVHLGPDDLPVALARAIAPPGFVIGASVGSEAEAAAAADADYWGIGPWRVTTTKADAGTGLGADGFARLAQIGRRETVPGDRRDPPRGRAPGASGRRGWRRRSHRASSATPMSCSEGAIREAADPRGGGRGTPRAWARV